MAREVPDAARGMNKSARADLASLLLNFGDDHGVSPALSRFIHA
jgi:hypothetical protein